MQSFTTYSQLIRPTWAPPSWVFVPVWSVLYAIIAISFGRVFWLVWKKKLPRKVALPFVLNIVFNALFTPLQFGLKINWLASFDILLVLATILWCMKVVYKKIPWIAYAQIPYLLWVSFATVLQLTIAFLNL